MRDYCEKNKTLSGNHSKKKCKFSKTEYNQINNIIQVEEGGINIEKTLVLETRHNSIIVTKITYLLTSH